MDAQIRAKCAVRGCTSHVPCQQSNLQLCERHFSALVNHPYASQIGVWATFWPFWLHDQALLLEQDDERSQVRAEKASALERVRRAP